MIVLSFPRPPEFSFEAEEGVVAELGESTNTGSKCDLRSLAVLLTGKFLRETSYIYSKTKAHIRYVFSYICCKMKYQSRF